MNLRGIDLNLLLAFEALMDERHVTRAARRLGLSQPAMSNALARLRLSLEDPLLVRAKTGMAPTPAAEELILPVRAALAQLREALEEPARFEARGSDRTFHLLANDYADQLLVVPLLARMQEEAPGLRFQVSRHGRLFEAPDTRILSETCDLAFGFFPDAPALDARLRSVVLWTERNVVIARRGHPRLRGALSAKEYAEARHVAVFYKTQGPGLIDALLAHQGLARRLAVLLPHFSTVPFLVAATDLIATVPEGLARTFARSLRLQVLEVPFAFPDFKLAMVWHERGDRDPAHQWLRERVVEVAGRGRAPRRRAGRAR